MRHNFVNDMGDYAKYALLRAICASSDPAVRLGVVWYLTDHEERNGDGRMRAHLRQDGWEGLDPELLVSMRRIEGGLRNPGDLNVGLIESSAILPTGTSYFAEAVPRVEGTAWQRVSERMAWFKRAYNAVADCDLVFLDPDNGLEVRSVPMSSPGACKYAFAAEISAFLESGKSVVLYQHGNRGPWLIQREQVCEQIRLASGKASTIRSLRFGAYGARAFFCVATSPRMAEIIEHGMDVLRRRVAAWDKARYLIIE